MAHWLFSLGLHSQSLSHVIWGMSCNSSRDEETCEVLYSTTRRKILIHFSILWETVTRAFPSIFLVSFKHRVVNLVYSLLKAQLQASVSIKLVVCNLEVAPLELSGPALTAPVIWPHQFGIILYGTREAGTRLFVTSLVKSMKVWRT